MLGKLLIAIKKSSKAHMRMEIRKLLIKYDYLDKYRIVPFLKNRGISKIDYAIISHVDKDHISGIEGILKKYSKMKR